MIQPKIPTPFIFPKRFPWMKSGRCSWFLMRREMRKSTVHVCTCCGKEGYVLAAPKLMDSISLTKNMVVAGQAIQKVASLLPIHNDRIYAAGEDSGGQFASLVPILINGVNGAMSIGASLSNSELINVKKPFHFIGMVSKENFNYPFMLTDTKLLDRYKFPNQVLLFDGNGNWPGVTYLQKGMQLFTLDAMGRKWIPMDSTYVEKAYQDDLEKVNQLKILETCCGRSNI